jgi:hypothetical protein
MATRSRRHFPCPPRGGARSRWFGRQGLGSPSTRCESRGTRRADRRTCRGHPGVRDTSAPRPRACARTRHRTPRRGLLPRSVLRHLIVEGLNAALKGLHVLLRHRPLSIPSARDPIPSRTAPPRLPLALSPASQSRGFLAPFSASNLHLGADMPPIRGRRHPEDEAQQGQTRPTDRSEAARQERQAQKKSTRRKVAA